jgi:hypothetical protein
MSDAGAPTLSEVLLGIGRDASRAPLEEYARTATAGAAGLGRQAGAAGVEPEPRVYASELLDRNTCGPCSMVDGAEYPSLEAGRADYPTGIYRACEGGPRCRGTLVFVWPDEAAPTVDDVERRPPPELPPPPTPEPDPGAARRARRAAEREAERALIRLLVDEEGWTEDEVDRRRRDVLAAREEVRRLAATARDESKQLLELTDATRLVTPPKLVRRRNPQTGEVRYVNPEGGEWDWFFALSPDEQARLRRGARSGAIHPDVLARQWAETFGGDPGDVDAAMREWLFHNRRIEAANALSLGRRPNPDLYGGVDPDDLIESPYRFDLLYGPMDDALRHIADVDDGEAGEYAARAFRRVRSGRPEPWTMSEAEWVREYETLRPAYVDIWADLDDTSLDPEDRPTIDDLHPDDRAILERFEELVPEGITDHDRPAGPREMYARMIELARVAGFLRRPDR